jgi:hypothetical protein
MRPSPQQKTSKRAKRKARSSGSSGDNSNSGNKSKQAKITSYCSQQSDTSISNAGEAEVFSPTPTLESVSSIMATASPAVAIDQKVLDEILQRLGSLDILDIIKNDMKDIKRDISDLAKSITYTQSQVDNIIEVQTTIVNENQKLKEQVHMLNYQNTFLNDKISQLEDYSRRENIKISGLEERGRENCEQIVYNILRHIGCDDVDLQRCHCVGHKTEGRHRDIIVRFMFYPAKVKVMQNRQNLPHGIYINDDFCAETQRHINTLRPVLRKAQFIDEQAKMVADKLFYKGRPYTVHNITAIDFDLEELSCKKNAQYTTFSGRYSVLSNLHPCQIMDGEQKFNSNEQYFQFRKCQEAGRDDIAAQVLLCSQPEDAMAVGKQVRMPNDWTNGTGKNIMKEGLRAKFSDPKLRKKLVGTGKLAIVEGTRHTLWGVGLPFTSPHLLNQHAWQGDNLMGQLLQEVREELAQDNSNHE